MHPRADEEVEPPADSLEQPRREIVVYYVQPPSLGYMFGNARHTPPVILIRADALREQNDVRSPFAGHPVDDLPHDLVEFARFGRTNSPTPDIPSRAR